MRTRTRKALGWGLAAWSAAAPLHALQSNTGGNAAEFLKIGAGARALGMAEAYGPVAEGPEAIYWNPAGLAQLKRPQVSYTRSEFLQFFHHDFLAYAHPVPLIRGTLAASITRLSQASLPVVTSANQEIGRFSPHSEAFTFAYAHSFEVEEEDRNFRDYFSGSWNLPAAARPLRHESEPWVGTVMIGGAVKIINETIHDRSASAFAFDAGGIFRPASIRSLSLSGTVRNLGTQETFIQEKEALPVEVGLGVAYDQRWWKSRLVPAFELVLPYYGSPHAKAGIEYRTPVAEATYVAVRGGYRTQSAVDLSPISGITFGLGCSHRSMTLDFGFQPMASLGQVYRLGLGWTF